MFDTRILNLSATTEAVLAIVQCHTFDHESTARLKDELAALARPGSSRPVLLDMSNVQFLASMTLGVLVEYVHAFDRVGRRFVLVGLSPKIRQMMQAGAILQLFEVRESAEHALLPM